MSDERLGFYQLPKTRTLMAPQLSTSSTSLGYVGTPTERIPKNPASSFAWLSSQTNRYCRPRAISAFGLAHLVLAQANPMS